MTPVIAGFHEQTAYSRRRENVCVTEFLEEVLRFELVDQFWGRALLPREGDALIG